MISGASGKRVLVTGGAIRFGAVLCRAFAENGAEVIVHYRTSAEAAEFLVRELPAKEGQKHFSVTCDLADPLAAVAMIDSLPPVDILVNNASVWIRSEGITPGAQRKQEAVNFISPCRMIERHAECAPEGACAVNILDAAVLCSQFQPATPYLAAKARLAEATATYAVQLAPSYRVNAIAPGPMIPPRGCSNNNMNTMRTTLPLKRPVSPDDVAEAVLFLAVCTSMTGVVLPVDCGCSLLGKSPY